jgi:putative transposase
VGDGALGFWKALIKVLGQTRSQRCWVHKTANILYKLPKHSQTKAKQQVHDIWMAETREDAEKALDLFLETYNAKYPKPLSALRRTGKSFWHSLGFPADHWVHIQTTNPIESTFSTVRLRTKKNKKLFEPDDTSDDGF